MKEEWQEIVENLYEKALETGCPKDIAQRLSLLKMIYLEEYDIEENEKAVRIRKQIPLKEHAEDFHNLKQQEKLSLLKKLGINTKFPYWLDVCIYNEQNKQFISEMVVGEERIDKKWTEARDRNGNRLASWAAQVASGRDHTLSSELSKLSGGRAIG
jgi:hypothetical protein